MTISLAHDFSLALARRVENISIANGSATDIGLKVLRGRRRLDPSQIPCAVIIERDDDPQAQSSGKVKISQKYIIEGHATCDPDNPNDTGHQIIADIKKAVFTGDLTIDGRLTANNQKAFAIKYLGRSIAPREDGLSVVAASVEISIEYVEELHKP